MSRLIDRTGEEKNNNFGSIIKITRYKNKRDIDVYFPEYDWTAENRQYGEFEKGTVRCPYEPRVYNKGYLGEGCYKTKIDNNTKHTDQYTKWKGMLERCYDYKYSLKHPTYIGCEVCKEWLNFQNFAIWYDENYYEIPGETMALDKDILLKRNKVYSPETCIFAPQTINTLFIKSDKNRGHLPVGVSKEHKKYSAQCCNTSETNRRIGAYPTPEEAFQAYKEFKEAYIKQVTDKYKDHVPDKLYIALYNYEVEYDD